MTPVNILTDSINTLWVWTYGLIAGWGLMFTLLVVAVVVLVIRQIKVEQRLKSLEQRLVHAERDYNLSVSKWRP